MARQPLPPVLQRALQARGSRRVGPGGLRPALRRAARPCAAAARSPGSLAGPVRRPHPGGAHGLWAQRAIVAPSTGTRAPSPRARCRRVWHEVLQGQAHGRTQGPSLVEPQAESQGTGPQQHQQKDSQRPVQVGLGEQVLQVRQVPDRVVTVLDPVGPGARRACPSDNGSIPRARLWVLITILAAAVALGSLLLEGRFGPEAARGGAAGRGRAGGGRATPGAGAAGGAPRPGGERAGC